MPATTEQASKPLDASEISRMFEAMRNGAFKAAPEATRPSSSAFTAKSLFDIARAASRDDPAAAPPKAKQTLNEIEDAEVLSDEPVATVDASVMDGLAQADAEVGADQSLFEEPNDRGEQEVDLASVLPPDQSQRPANLDELKAEWGRGFAAGEARALADMSATVEERLSVLDAAIVAFRSADGVADLRHEILEAVKQWASIRAGAQIDEMPAPYLTKVEDLVDRIRNDLAQPRLRMNPDDIAAIKPYLAASETLSSIIISADADLARGDIELSTDNLRYADRLMPKLAPGAMVRRSAEATADEVTETASCTSE
jgi:flagellar biosynthesis/type III secretory pathway protein FliH